MIGKKTFAISFQIKYLNKLTNPNGAATDTDVMQIKTNKDLMFSPWNPGIEWYDVLQSEYF